MKWSCAILFGLDNDGVVLPREKEKIYVDVHWLSGDLTHAIVKRGCRDQDVIDLSERLDYVDESGDGSLDRWYY